VTVTVLTVVMPGKYLSRFKLRAPKKPVEKLVEWRDGGDIFCFRVQFRNFDGTIEPLLNP
jgi:hypothetical protein